MKTKSFFVSLSLLTLSILLFFCNEVNTIKKYNLENQKFSIYFVSSLIPLEEYENFDIILEKNSEDENKDINKFISKITNRNNNEELSSLLNQYSQSKYIYIVRTNKKINSKNIEMEKFAFNYEINESFNKKILPK